jgi:hypothetical protein
LSSIETIDQVDGQAELGNLSALPSVLSIDLPDGFTPVALDLTDFSRAQRAELSALVFESDTPVILSLPKLDDIVVVLGNGANSLTSKGGTETFVQTGTGIDSIKLASGRDTVVLAGGEDSVRSGSGSDLVKLQELFLGTAEVRGGEGRDTLDLSDVEIVSVERGTGADKGFVVITLDSGSSESLLRVKGFERFVYDADAGLDRDIQTVGLKALLRETFDPPV